MILQKLQVGDAFVKYLETFDKSNKEFECKELFTLYSIDVVATSGFGMEANTFSDPNCMFKDQVCVNLSKTM